jgi:hypothetical protein
MGSMEPLTSLTHDAAGLLPSQAEHSACSTPEKALWFSVLCQSLQDASGHPVDIGGTASARPARAERLIVAARAWVSSNANRLGTFRWCCEIFGIDPDCVRTRLRTGLPITFDRDMSAGAAVHSRSEGSTTRGGVLSCVPLRLRRGHPAASVREQDDT